MGQKCRQFGLLLWKNFQLQRRKPVVTAFEILIPVIFSLILILIRQRVEVHHVTVPIRWTSFSADSFPSKLSPKESTLGSFFDFFSSAKPLPWKLYYSPNTSLAAEVMMNVKEQLGPKSISDVIPFPNDDEMAEDLVHFLELANTNQTVICDVLAAVSFPPLEASDLMGHSNPEQQFQYQIRLPSSPRNSPSLPFGLNKLQGTSHWNTEFLFPLLQKIGPREEGSLYGGVPGYMSEGFLTLQHQINVGLIRALDPNVSEHSLHVQLQRFPYPPYLDDNFVLVIQQQLPSIILISFIFSALQIVKEVVHEKEHKLKEWMKMMGLNGWLHWMAWFVKHLIFLSLSIFLITALICIPVGGLKVVGYTHWSVVLMFLICYAVATISFCFMISVFFKKANTGAAAGGILFFLSFVPYAFLQPRYSSLSWASKIGSSLISNIAMAYGCEVIGMFEGTGAGVQWATLNKPATVDDTFTLLQVMLMLLIDAFIYGLVTWYVEAVYPGEYGLPQPWRFPFTKSYWFGTVQNMQDEILASGRQDPDDYESTSEDAPLLQPSPSSSTSQLNSDEYFEAEPLGLTPGIKIRNLKKEFGKGPAKTVAVNGIDLTMFQGQITVLLGHNGAGKTTTMSMLTGFLPPTSGTAYVYGYDIRSDIASVRQSLGLCPQHDILFDNLTVEEHLLFFAKLKGFPSDLVTEEIENMLSAIGLADKRRALSKTLSGGMRRKLSMGIALVGGSKVVILDEPTSGMDPNARRQAWEILLKQRSNRTIVLTTHFMDEADILGDRIAIMAEGSLQCAGTPLFLKNKYGAGYHLVFVKMPECDVSRVTEHLQSFVPDAELESNMSAELSYILPHESKAEFQALFTSLDKRKDELKIAGYGASVTTMEEVFLRVGEEVDADLREKLQQKVSADLNSVNDDPPLNGLFSELGRNSGSSLYVQQFYGMFVKRFLHTWRNRLVTVSQLLVPFILTLIALIVIKTMPAVDDSPPLTLNLTRYGPTFIPIKTAEGDLNMELSHVFAQQFANSASTLQEVPTNESLSEYLIKKGEASISEYNLQYMIAAHFYSPQSVNPESKSIYATAHFNDQSFHTPAITLNAMDNALLHFLTNATFTLSAVNHPLPRTITEQVDDQMTKAYEGFSVAFNVLFGMAFLASSFVIFLIKERASRAKHCQFVSGVHVSTFWASTFCWDFINFLVPSVLLMFTFMAFKVDAYSGTFGRALSVWLLLLLYGWAILPCMYLFSFWFSQPASGVVWLTMINHLSGVTAIMTVTILSIPQLGTASVGRALEWVFLLLTPNYCLGQGLADFYNNHQYLQICDNPAIQQLCKFPIDFPCCQASCEINCVYYNHNYLGWAPSGIGRSLVFLAIQGVLYWLFVLLIDSGALQAFIYLFGCNSSRAETDPANPVQLDDDVAAEKQRIFETPLSNMMDSLILKDLTKDYGKLRAVDGLSVGIMPGECFGLLGINGAGKSSTFKMLTGDESVSDGNAWLDGFDIKSNIRMVQQRLGYCPQYDALIDQMTGTETLTLYARLRGIPEPFIPQLTATLTRALVLENHAHKLVQEYSGGNKRKLSTAIALVGQPPIIFLDEPTTGMDPVARRLLWDTLCQVRSNGRTLVLTSHSMEECEALCTRIAIMVNGQFRCLGSPQHLKNKFGEGFTLIVKLGYPSPDRSFPHGSSSRYPQLERLMEFIENTFPGSVLKDVHQGMVHYHITNPQERLAHLFGVMEHIKEEFSIEDYSVSQTTLEQVFINFARAQNPPQEAKGGFCNKCSKLCRMCCCCYCRSCCCSRAAVEGESEDPVVEV